MIPTPTRLLAIWIGKLSGAALRAIGRRGNALPGLIVERVFPRFLTRALSGLEHGVVVVSGTNGKTTTTKMVATILSRRHAVLTNDTGSNFVRGAITAVCDHASWSGRIDAQVAVFELDEAHAVRFVEVVRPDRVLLLNVMRDQLDRFGEIDTTAGLLRTVAKAAGTAVVLNRDDPRVAAIAEAVSASVTYYGVSAALRPDFPTDEELYGAQPDDGAPATVARATAELQSLELGETSRLRMRIDAHEYDIDLRAGGAHNAQNAAGAAALALTFGLPSEVIADGLRDVEPAFGRGQSFDVDERRLVLHLVKNPAGFRQTLRTVAAHHAEAVMIAINDDYADGRDVSWLWDVDFVAPLADDPHRQLLLTSGTRAADMALRLRYDGIGTDVVLTDLRDAVRHAVHAVPVGRTVVVLSTYTAMWALHAILTDIGTPVGRADAELTAPAADGAADGRIP